MQSTIWHPFTQHGLGKQEIHVAKSQGAYLYRPDGGRIIDAISSWWVITHGHCHPKIVDAVQQQAQTLDQVIFAGFTHTPAQQVSKALLARAGDHHKYSFFSDSGSTAVEVALKMAVGYWHHRGEKRQKIIALEGAYHGDTFGTMAAGERCVFNKVYEPYLFDVIHVPVPLPGAEEEALAALDAVLDEHGDDVAAFIFEPLVQGAGGMRMYAPDMLKAMCTACQQSGALLIADEVMTGFGRTGSFFACDQAGVSPDLMAVSKGLTGGFLPMGITVATQEIYDAFYHEDRAKMFYHSSSFTGNPMACAAACASLKIWDDEDVFGRIGAIADQHRAATKALQALPNVEKVTQCGTILALQCRDNNASGYLANIGQEFYDFAMARGILMRALGSVMYILPPYCISAEDLSEIYQCISDFLNKRK